MYRSGRSAILGRCLFILCAFLLAVSLTAFSACKKSGPAGQKAGQATEKSMEKPAGQGEDKTESTEERIREMVKEPYAAPEQQEQTSGQ
jgi:hypothetical protein